MERKRQFMIVLPGIQRLDGKEIVRVNGEEREGAYRDALLVPIINANPGKCCISNGERPLKWRLVKTSSSN